MISAAGFTAIVGVTERVDVPKPLTLMAPNDQRGIAKLELTLRAVDHQNRGNQS